MKQYKLLSTTLIFLKIQQFLNFFLPVFFTNSSDIETLQFQMTFEIPHIQVKAKYRSSGVLILVRASGAGDYWGEYGMTQIYLIFTHNNSNHSTITIGFYLPHWQLDGVRAKVYFKAIPVDVQDGLTYMKVEEAKMDFTVKEIQMGVDNVAGGNPVIRKPVTTVPIFPSLVI